MDDGLSNVLGIWAERAAEPAAVLQSCTLVGICGEIIAKIFGADADVFGIETVETIACDIAWVFVVVFFI